MFNPWLALTFQAARLTWEAPGVMALRMMKFAGGGSTTRSEASVMIPEKAATFSEAQVVATSAVPAGSSGARTGLAHLAMGADPLLYFDRRARYLDYRPWPSR